MNEAQGIKVDVDFQVMVESQMRQVQPMKPVRSFVDLRYCSIFQQTN